MGKKNKGSVGKANNNNMGASHGVKTIAAEVNASEVHNNSPGVVFRKIHEEKLQRMTRMNDKDNMRRN